jgi:hypothetical protein
MNLCSSYAKCRCWKEWVGKTLLNKLCWCLCVLMMNDERNVIRWALCPPRVRSMGRGKPSVSLTFGQREVMKPETISSSQSIQKSATIWVALTISESATTQFSSIIVVSAANYFSLLNCVVYNKLDFAV